MEQEYMDSVDLEELTGTPASTWRYWAHIGSGPPSFKLVRRVWKRATVLAWLESQESSGRLRADATVGAARGDAA